MCLVGGVGSKYYSLWYVCDHAEFPASMSLVFNFSFDLRIFLSRGLNKTTRRRSCLV